MSTANRYFPGTGKEKSSFAMTCNRLSLFLKEKGSLRDIGINANFNVKGKPDLYSPATETEANKTTVDLLSKIESPVNMLEKPEKSVTHLPQFVTIDSFCRPSDSTHRAVSGESSMESNTAPMTIFYGGQVLVFDCVPADKARDMMLAASGFQNSNSRYEDFDSQRLKFPELELNGSDMPIARRSSLHKFLAKRKERATERAPYQLPNRLMAAPAPLSHKFDLNL